MSGDVERRVRIGLNESVFRAVNEQLEALADELHPELETLDLVCECGNRQCAERIAVKRDLYERVRADPLLFFVVPGHELPDVEEVVAAEAGVNIVRKCDNVPAAVAVETDPRAGDG